MKKIILYFSFLFCFISACEPLTETFDEEHADCIFYDANSIKSIEPVDSSILLMTWNIRFGCARIPWFGDACGDRVILSKTEINSNLQAICNFINLIKPQILLLQEVDIKSKRTAYIDQVQFILDKTHLNYGVYASGWKSQFIPTDGLGRMDCGNAILSVWKIDEAVRHSLPLRNDADALTKYFYLRDNIIVAKIQIPGISKFYTINVHLVSTTGDDTKKRQVAKLIDIVDSLINKGENIIAGGDFNLIPPNSDTTDFCLVDKCPKEHFHGPNDNPQHKDGSNYTDEIIWMEPVYNMLKPSISLTEFKLAQSKNFTHSLSADIFWCRMIDYLFTNSKWIDGSHQVYQESMQLSDHAPVTAKWRIK